MPKRHSKPKPRQNVIQPKKGQKTAQKTEQKNRSAGRVRTAKEIGAATGASKKKPKLVSENPGLSKRGKVSASRTNKRPETGTKKGRTFRVNKKGKSKVGSVQNKLRKTATEKINKRITKSNLTTTHKIKPRIGFVKHFGKRVKDTNTGQYRRAYTIDLSHVSGIENKINYLRSADMSFIDQYKFYRISTDNYAVMKDYFIQIVRKVKQQLYYSKLYFGFPPGEFDAPYIKKFIIDTVVEYNNEFTDRLSEDEDGEYLQGSGATFNPSKIIGIQMQFVYFKSEGK